MLKLGGEYEEVALKYLQQQGCSLVHKNYYSRYGEIDLIVKDGSTFAFIEVKYRSSGINSESINKTKQLKVVKTAQYYLPANQIDSELRFDAVLVDRHYNIDWIKILLV